MAEPTKKSPEINAFLSLQAGRDREQTIKNDVCMMCGGDAIDFRNEISKREYSISGMCQKCQDKTFEVD